MIRWITQNLGTGAWTQIDRSTDIQLLDVRDLVDKSGNAPSAINAKIEDAIAHLRNGKKVVVCCDYGMSRSNAIASGILAKYEGVTLNSAIKRVIAATEETAIKIEVLSAVRRAIGEEITENSLLSKTNRRLLLTGGSGFIGSLLFNYLSPDWYIVAPSRQEISLVEDTVSLDLLVKEHDIDTVVHLANPRIYTTNESMGTALVMIKNILDVCQQNNLFLVYLSSWEIYSGYKTQQLRADEFLQPRPGGTYGQAKFLCEALIQHYQLYQGLCCAILRSSPVYGLGSDKPKFIWNFLNKALRNEEIVTHQYINGFPMLDLLHVDDLCKAIVAAIERGVEDVINLGTGIGISTAQISERIVNYLSSQSQISHLKIDVYTSNIVMDTSRAAAKLGWHPQIEWQDGLKTIVDDASSSIR